MRILLIMKGLKIGNESVFKFKQNSLPENTLIQHKILTHNVVFVSQQEDRTRCYKIKFHAVLFSHQLIILILYGRTLDYDQVIEHHVLAVANHVSNGIEGVSLVFMTQ